MKRTLSLFLALVLVFSFGMAFAEGEKPVISVMTIKAGAALPDGVTVDSSDYLAQLEEMTGFDIEWSCFNEGSADELRLLLAGGTDTRSVQTSRDGVLSGCVSIPCRNIHTPGEIVSLKDVEQTGKLLAAAARLAL